MPYISESIYIQVLISCLIWLIGSSNLLYCNKIVNRQRIHFQKANIDFEQLMRYLKYSKKVIVIEGFVIIIILICFLVTKSIYFVILLLFSTVLDVLVIKRIKIFDQSQYKINILSLDKNENNLNEIETIIKENNDRELIVYFFVFIIMIQVVGAYARNSQLFD